MCFQWAINLIFACSNAAGVEGISDQIVRKMTKDRSEKKLAIVMDALLFVQKSCLRETDLMSSNMWN